MSAGDAVSADLTSVKNVLSVLSTRFTSLASDVSHIRSAVSNVSAESAGGSATGIQAVVNLLSNKISALGAGGGSVTSAEVSAVSQNASANAVSIANVVSAQAASAIASEISNRTSADNAVSNAASANAVSIRNAQSIGGHANASINSPTSSQVLKYNSADAKWVNSADATGGAGGSATSAEVSAGDASVLNAASANAISIGNVVSAQAASAINVVSVALLSEISNRTSADNAVSNAASANAVSIANVVSAQAASAISVVAANLSLLSVAHTSLASTVSHMKSAVSNVSAQSAGGSATGLQAVIDLLSNKISAGGGGGLTSDQTSAMIAAKLSALSFTFSTVSVKGQQSVNNQLASVISDAMSAGDAVSADLTSVKSVLLAKAPWFAAKAMVASAQQSIAASALANISGMVLTVAAGETWRFEGGMYVHTSSPTAGVRIGFSVPPLSTPRYAYLEAASAGAFGSSAIGMQVGGQLHASGPSVLMSLASSQAAVGSAQPIEFKGLFNVASAGTFAVMAAVVNSATASPIHINGAWMMAYRLK
jgi:hypothetical protein